MARSWFLRFFLILFGVIYLGAFLLSCGNATLDGSGGGSSGSKIAIYKHFIYSVLNAGGANIKVYSVDTTTGVLSAAGSYSLAASNPNTVLATSKFLYVGAADKKVYGYAIDAVTGALSPLNAGAFLIGPQANLFLNSSLATDASGSVLFVLDGLVAATVNRYDINPVTGALTNLATTSFGGEPPVGISTDPTGKILLVATNTKIHSIPISGFPAENTPANIATAPQYPAVSTAPGGYLYVGTNLASFAVSSFTFASNGALGAEVTSASAPVTSIGIGGNANQFLYAGVGTNLNRFDLTSGNATGASSQATGVNIYEINCDPSGSNLWTMDTGAPVACGSAPCIRAFSINQATGVLTSAGFVNPGAGLIWYSFVRVPQP
jgi:hypothetical protein